VLAWQGPDGHPIAVPALSLRPGPADRMFFGTGALGDRLDGLVPGARVAASVLTMDPMSYQVKGVLEACWRLPWAGLGVIRIDEAYSASPPLPGEPIPRGG
jgi:hypothetical protein